MCGGREVIVEEFVAGLCRPSPENRLKQWSNSRSSDKPRLSIGVPGSQASAGVAGTLDQICRNWPHWADSGPQSAGLELALVTVGPNSAHSGQSLPSSAKISTNSTISARACPSSAWVAPNLVNVGPISIDLGPI